MKGLAELVVSLCDLCEAEGRLLEAGILRTVRRAALLSLGLLFGAAALALLLAALYALLTTFLPRPATLALLGCASAAIAGLFLWRARDGAGPAAQDAPAVAGPQDLSGGSPDGVPVAPGPAPAQSHGHGVWEEAVPYARRTSVGRRDQEGCGPGGRK